MLFPHMPITLGASFRGKPLLASAKADYTNIFYHGDNLEDVTGALTDFDSRTDNFARQNYLVRLPKVVRFMIGSTGLATFTHYADIAETLADEFASDGICFSWGMYEPQLTFRFLLNTTPGMGAIAAADLYAGEVLTFFLSFRHLNYSFHDSANAPNAQYTSDYQSFTTRHPRHVRFRGYFWNNFHTSGAFDDEQVINDAMAGTGAFASLGPGLSTYGWSADHSTQWDQPATLLSASDFRPKIVSFFGLT